MLHFPGGICNHRSHLSSRTFLPARGCQKLSPAIVEPLEVLLGGTEAQNAPLSQRLVYDGSSKTPKRLIVSLSAACVDRPSLLLIALRLFFDRVSRSDARAGARQSGRLGMSSFHSYHSFVREVRGRRLMTKWWRLLLRRCTMVV
jgi:hypothetical protein